MPSWIIAILSLPLSVSLVENLEARLEIVIDAELVTVVNVRSSDSLPFLYLLLIKYS